MLLTCSCICLCIVIIALITIRPVVLANISTLNIFIGIDSVLGYFHVYMHIRYMYTPLYILNAPYVIKLKDTFTQSSNVYNYSIF